MSPPASCTACASIVKSQYGTATAGSTLWSEAEPRERDVLVQEAEPAVHVVARARAREGVVRARELADRDERRAGRAGRRRAASRTRRAAAKNARGPRRSARELART